MLKNFEESLVELEDRARVARNVARREGNTLLSETADVVTQLIQTLREDRH